jgi:hypothetical protein
VSGTIITVVHYSIKEEKNYNQLRLDAANLLQLGQQFGMPCKATSSLRIPAA